MEGDLEGENKRRLRGLVAFQESVATELPRKKLSVGRTRFFLEQYYRRQTKTVRVEG